MCWMQLDHWTSLSKDVWFYESGCLPLGPEVELLFREEEKRLLSSSSLSELADQTHKSV